MKTITVAKMESDTMAKQIQLHDNEEKIYLPSRYTAEGLVCRLILNSHFTASIKSIREMRNGETIYRVILTKREGR
jgi:hypothetical protein